jgi:hypothetical protein
VRGGNRIASQTSTFCVSSAAASWQKGDGKGNTRLSYRIPAGKCYLAKKVVLASPSNPPMSRPSWRVPPNFDKENFVNFRTSFIFLLAGCAAAADQKVAPEKEAAMKADLAGQIDGMKKQAQVMVDSVFSFGELGFQEFETSKYLSGILEKEGFKVERGIAGIPTAFVATWGQGKPVIALGSDIDDIPQTRQSESGAYGHQVAAVLWQGNRILALQRGRRRENSGPIQMAWPSASSMKAKWPSSSTGRPRAAIR